MYESVSSNYMISRITGSLFFSLIFHENYSSGENYDCYLKLVKNYEQIKNTLRQRSPELKIKITMIHISSKNLLSKE